MIDCAGAAMVESGTDSSPVSDAVQPDPPMVRLGKRYEHTELGVEVLCTKAGPGPLVIDGTELLEKGAKPLPSSD